MLPTLICTVKNKTLNGHYKETWNVYLIYIKIVISNVQSNEWFISIYLTGPLHRCVAMYNCKCKLCQMRMHDYKCKARYNLQKKAVRRAIAVAKCNKRQRNTTHEITIYNYPRGCCPPPLPFNTKTHDNYLHFISI